MPVMIRAPFTGLRPFGINEYLHNSVDSVNISDA
jgi:hypothetical protein